MRTTSLKAQPVVFILALLFVSAQTLPTWQGALTQQQHHVRCGCTLVVCSCATPGLGDGTELCSTGRRADGGAAVHAAGPGYVHCADVQTKMMTTLQPIAIVVGSELPTPFPTPDDFNLASENLRCILLPRQVYHPPQATAL